eukprot:CAMPEP_0181202558 /NCGR_PEP_ID=MMETSP1096-20121128/18911_1 /TAXON_ID=156174 ORGANISM="Chrysochromulina ericina, Strain CCMP281" /NCGR_SAMPLE_ID=MMETSP1096 /ASSEMBLY_ACC=CAM_ASM_000453 /LENGTH=47 /DNA_ID= /DNA_START= /DNA_END= /DNA_ORIENTATION=
MSRQNRRRHGAQEARSIVKRKKKEYYRRGQHLEARGTPLIAITVRAA